jgi:hypothetical protein
VTLQPMADDPPDDGRDSRDGIDELLNAANTAATSTGRHRRPRRARWPRVVERAIGGWAPTLRMATLIVIVLAAGLACVLIVWGVLGVACVALLYVLIRGAVSWHYGPLNI